MISVSPFEGSAVEWDAFIATQAEATFCHLGAWREVMRDVMGHRADYLVAREPGGALVGALPLVRVKSPILGHFLVSMPFLNAGGPLGSTEAQEALVNAAAEQARRTRADLLELRSRSVVPGGLRVSGRKITVHLPLPDTSEALWASFPGKLRSQVRRPQKEGFTVRFGLGECDAFYGVFAQNMRVLGTPVLSRKLFQQLVELFPGNVEFAVVYHGETPIASGCGFRYRSEFELTWASSLREYNKQAPNMLLYWSLMERMTKLGIKTFDFGRCTPDSGTHAFKKQWGGHDVALPWAQWSERAVDSTPSPNKGLYRYAVAAWQRLPLAVTNAVGPFIAKRLP